MTMAGPKRTLSSSNLQVRQDMERQRYHGRIDRGIRWGLSFLEGKGSQNGSQNGSQPLKSLQNPLLRGFQQGVWSHGTLNGRAAAGERRHLLRPALWLELLWLRGLLLLAARRKPFSSLASHIHHIYIYILITYSLHIHHIFIAYHDQNEPKPNKR